MSVRHSALVIFKVVLGLLIAAAAPFAWGSDSAVPWVVHYANKAPLSAYDPYKVIVVDSDAHPNLSELKQSGQKIVLGYISVGEVESYRKYFSLVKQQGLLMHENANWPNSWMVDLRSKKWVSVLLDHVAPSILASGFDGFFLDTVDNAEYLESLDPVSNAGMEEAAKQIILDLRARFPNAKIMMNRGYAVLPDVGRQIDYLLAESVYSSFDFKQSRYFVVENQQYQEHLNILMQAQKKFPDLKIMTLDYWDPNDKEGFKKIYTLQKNNGFSPFVATIELDRIITPTH